MSLEKGNAFLSDWWGHDHGTGNWQHYVTDTILRDTVIADGRKFYYCTNHLFYDSDSIRLSYLGTDSEIVICDFRWGVGDTVVSRGYRSVVRDKGVESIFNESQPYITLGFLETSETITKKFGQTEYDYYGIFSVSHKRLIGARINGVVYGTRPTNVTQNGETSDQPTQSIFPNPSSRGFNIQINVKQSLDLIIEIFNILGQNVARIYDGRVNIGNHVYRWDGNGLNSQTLPSGIYFARFLVGSNAIQHKIILFH